MSKKKGVGVTVGVGAGLSTVLAGALFSSGAGVAGCASCDCIPTGVTVSFAAGVNPGDVREVLASGPACEGSTPRCLGAGAPCTAYAVQPSAEGACRVEVRFDNGRAPAVHDATIRRSNGCCAGYFADANGWNFTVGRAEAGAPSDASADAPEASRD